MDCICVSNDTRDGVVLAACDGDSNLIVHWFDGDRLHTRACKVKQLWKQSQMTRMAWNPTSSSCSENDAHPCSNGSESEETIANYLMTVHVNDQVLVWKAIFIAITFL